MQVHRSVTCCVSRSVSKKDPIVLIRREGHQEVDWSRLSIEEYIVHDDEADKLVQYQYFVRRLRWESSVFFRNI